MTQLTIGSLRLDGGTQPRAAIDEATVREYAEAMQDGATFPPVVVFHDGVDNWLADGFHRVHAARSLGLLDIDAEVRTGTRRDAVLYAMGTNAAHGMRRTSADKRRAVLTLLEDEEWGQWSDREIARRCAVSHDFVSRLRPSLSSNDSDPAPAARTYTDRHGNTSTMNTEKIGRRQRVPGGIADDAFQPTYTPPARIPMVALNVPQDPELCADLLLSQFGEDFAEAVAAVIVAKTAERRKVS